MTIAKWSLRCSRCDENRDADGLPTLCDRCQSPWLVTYSTPPPPSTRSAFLLRPWNMWRYREWLPILDGEVPVSLGEGMTPLLSVPHMADSFGLSRLWIKDESVNPTYSFKARGLSAAVTRARAGGATRFTVPTAGNAGVALSAYAVAAGIPAHVFAPETTPPRILDQIRVYGGNLELIDGHIGDCGQRARAFAAQQGGFDVSTLKEPYRIEGKKTLGLELAEQLDWDLPDAIIYPTGGGTGLIGMWKCFNELRDAGWVTGTIPRLYSVQSTGCAPVVEAFRQGADETSPWPDPETVASGLRVPAPLGGALSLRAIRDTGGSAVAVDDEELMAGAAQMAGMAAVDASPEGGATLSALRALRASSDIVEGERVVLFNTGAGWLYR